MILIRVWYRGAADWDTVKKVSPGKAGDFTAAATSKVLFAIEDQMLVTDHFQATPEPVVVPA